MPLSARVLAVSMSFAFLAAGATGASAQTGDVVVYASGAHAVGNWAVVADASAAGGSRLANVDHGAAKLATPLAAPADYFDLTFDAPAGVGYRLWIRGVAQKNAYTNDSAYVQFSDSVTASGAAQFRIGTTSATTYTLEDCSGCGESGWGWNDNFYGSTPGELIYFATGGTHTARVQIREDGLSIDQFVLSPSTYASQAPGAAKNDATILAETPRNVVLYASAAKTVGNWTVVSDATAAGGARLADADQGMPKIAAALPSPADYFELTFDAAAGAYRLWMRGQAQNNSYSNDSAFVQFSDSVTASGAPAFRIGTTAATVYSLEDCSGCGDAGWGWNDNYYGSATGTLIYFPTSGPHVIRVQTREDGLSLDQIVLSPSTFMNAAPGTAKNDTVILPLDGSLPTSSTSSSDSAASGGGSTTGGSTTSSGGTVSTDQANLPPVFAAAPGGFRISALAPAVPVAPATVFLSASATGPESTDTLTYTWSFGDGTPDVQTTPSSEASRQNVVHTYTTAGTFTARVTVEDQAHNTSVRSQTVTVGAPVPTTAGQPLKIMQWNTYKARTTDTRTEGSKVWFFARWIAAVNPDVVLMQEVMGSNIAKSYVAELDRLTGRTWSYFYRSDSNVNSSTAQGVAILTSLPILSTASIAYAPCPNAQIVQRAAIAVTVPVNGRNVTLFDTHLSSYSGTADMACRTAQAQQLTSWMQSFAEPRLLTGDLNASPDEQAIAIFTGQNHDTWLDAVNSGRAIAYPDNLPNASLRTRSERIDYVMTSRGTNVLELVAEQVPDTRDFSNHNPIYAQGKTSWAPHNYAPRVSDHEAIIATFVVH